MADDRIDTRDLVEELTDLAGSERSEADDHRVDAIRALFDEISSYAGDSPEDGIFLISEDTFEDYARELADDIGAVVGEGWPAYCIDWAWAARELARDYTTVDFDGATYYYR